MQNYTIRSGNTIISLTQASLSVIVKMIEIFLKIFCSLFF